MAHPQGARVMLCVLAGTLWYKWRCVHLTSSPFRSLVSIRFTAGRRSFCTVGWFFATAAGRVGLETLKVCCRACAGKELAVCAWDAAWQDVYSSRQTRKGL